MTSLLPSLQAADLRRALTDYLGTTFALTDEAVRDSLDAFLSDPAGGVFRGPYARLRLPFKPADGTWAVPLDWYPNDFVPYGHQAKAFARLSSKHHAPQATLVITGTGSGKTESFLIPILDHVLRERRKGKIGVKALILYPMNALAADQSGRLAGLITGDPRLSGITAGLYTGDQTTGRTRVSDAGLITDRAIMRDDPPDILLTNYKMLDQLLLRAADAKIWRLSRESLTYVVLDEFHTYDGAQGTDVAMLLRRLGLVLGVNRPDSPLGNITPVATSATLGGSGGSQEMTSFAATVFGCEFDDDSVITEQRLTSNDWLTDAAQRWTKPDLFRAVPIVDLNKLAEEIRKAEDPNAAIATLIRGLWVRGGPDVSHGNPATENDSYAEELTARDAAKVLDGPDLAALLAAHRLTAELIELSGRPIAIRDLAAKLFPEDASPENADGLTILEAYLGALSLVRTSDEDAEAGRHFPFVDVQLWVRELTRVDRAVTAEPEFRWSDDGVGTDGDDFLPAIYCRHCGRSGWAVVLAPTGMSLETDDSAIRRRRFVGDDRFRALIYARGEAAADERGAIKDLAWLDISTRELLTRQPESPLTDDASAIPVLVDLVDAANAGSRRPSQRDTCPACGLDDGIRFLGSSIATLASVSLSSLFGSPWLDAREKKTLLFTDSVQDAAHRAGFVQTRSHTLSLRAALRHAVGDGEFNLSELASEVIKGTGDDPFRRYSLLPPALVERDRFEPFWNGKGDRTAQREARDLVRARLAFDIALEFGLNSRTGRTLELTGSLAAEVAAGPPTRLHRIARATIEAAREQFSLAGDLDDQVGAGLSEAKLVAWVRGVLERVRTRGGIDHRWLSGYLTTDGNRWEVWGGRPRDEGMPAFPPGRPAPAFPTTARGSDSFDAVTSPQSWYALWAERCLRVTARDGAVLSRALLARLAAERILSVVTTSSGASVYTIHPESIVVAAPKEPDLIGGRHSVRCDVCQTMVPGTSDVIDQLTGAPCLVIRCTGMLRPEGRGADYYRSLYASKDMRRVVAGEHTSLLKDSERRAREEGFKQGNSPADPNVLVATPTLELGIDIGDLSTVMLGSMPRSVAAYLQRVGRAGRLTGNALVLAYVRGRGSELPRLSDPLSVIDGEVRPPATYLDAAEILQRQYIAHLLDRRATRPGASETEPARAEDALGTWEPGSWAGDLLADARTNANRYSSEFLSQFASFVRPDTAAELRRFAGVDLEDDEPSGLENLLHWAIREWRGEVDELGHRSRALAEVLPKLQHDANQQHATDAEKSTYRSCRAELRALRGRIHEIEHRQYWVQALEERGLLPNYTLLDDNVTLDIDLNWIDQDTGEFDSQNSTIGRGSRVALTEFAPGATFYARGTAVRIDAVDVGTGVDVEAGKIENWRVCASCGWIGTPHDVVTAPSVCPRCNDNGVADTGQQLEVVPLTRVSAQARRDDVLISDSHEDREKESFVVVTAADVDPTNISAAWRLADYPFGAEYIRQLTIRWLNLGRAGQSGRDRFIAGEQTPAPLFRVCPGCGISPAAQRRDEQNARHRGWCRHRTEITVPWREVALARSLRTQAVRLLVPAQFLLDHFAAESLRAALLLGLREVIGGDPDHLDIVLVNAPVGGRDQVAMLVHDTVPGGTGYLSDFARPDRVRELLQAAVAVLRNCPCQEDGLLACHRCLLPFAPLHVTDKISRSRGVQIIDDILSSGRSTAGDWSIEHIRSIADIPPPSNESHLEQRFRTLLVKALRDRGIAVREEPVLEGSTVHITMPGATTRRWALRPQVSRPGVRPDFVLTTADPSIPEICIFTDGLRFHAVPDLNRIADDASKRASLRAAGAIVWAVTSADLDRFERILNGGADSGSTWLNPAEIERVLTSAAAGSADVALISKDSVSQLLAFLADPNELAWARLAAVLPLAFADHNRLVQTSLDRAGSGALEAMDGHSPASEGPSRGWWWRSPHGLVSMCVLTSTDPVAVDSVLAVDDRSNALGTDSGQQAWREWLSVSNLLGFSDRAPQLTTWSLLTSGAAAPVSRPPLVDSAFPAEAALPLEWRELVDAALSQGERDLLVALAPHGVPLPEQGYETELGTPIDLAWPRRMLAIHADEEERATLIAAGWAVLPPDAEMISQWLNEGAS